MATICGFDNGILQVAAVGGNPPYTYDWSHDADLTINDARNLPAGDYSVTITDANGCSISGMYNIGESEIPTADIVEQGDAGCGQANGFIRVETANLTAPYTYEWDHDDDLNAPLAENLTSGDYSVTITGDLGCSVEIQTSVSNPDGPSISEISVENSSCSATDGTASVTISGGTSPYSYEWSHDVNLTESTATNLPPGEYSLTITDANGCFDTETFNIQSSEGPGEITIVQQTGTFCGLNNGALLVTPVGGTAPYTYVWSHDPSLVTNEALDLLMGDYSVTITDVNGCAVSGTYSIAGSETPTIMESSQSNSSCGQNDGSATVVTTGLTDPLSYTWSHDPELNAATANDLAAGNYTVTATGANGCTATLSLTIENSGGPQISLTSAINSSCGMENGAINVAYQSGGTPPFNYSWSHDSDLNEDAAEGLSAGNYGVTITDVNGCSNALNVELIEVAGPGSLTIVSMTPTSCGESNGALTIVPTGGTPPFTYEWSHDATITGDNATELDSGVYQIVATDANGCSISNTFSIPTSMGLTVVQDEVIGANCNLEDGSILISVPNASGEVTYNWSHAPGQNSPALTGLTAGNYMVTVTDEAGCSSEAMIIVNSLDNPASFTITPTPTNCEDGQGSITVTITEGRPPYTYVWSHDALLDASTATGLIAGDYNVEVTDALGCKVMLEATVIYSDGPEVTIDAAAPTCAGASDGSLIARPTGGAEPFSYLWSTNAVSQSVSNLVAGDYSVTVTDANGCTETVETTLTDGPVLIISLLDSVPPTCAESLDGRLEVEVSGGSAPYVFIWSNGTNGPLTDELNGGTTYTVTVTSSEGCQAERSYTLPDAPVAVLQLPTDTTLCQDDIWALDLTGYTNTLVTGPGGFNSNEPVVLIDEAGTYSISVAGAGGCMANADVVVNFTGQTFVAGMVLPSDVVVGDSIVVLETSWPAPSTVEWIFDRSGARQVAQEQNQYWFVFDEAGEYNLSLLASFDGCDDLITKGITVHADSTSIPSVGLTRSGIEDIIISPNPNDGNFTATVDLTTEARIFLNLYDLDGTLIDRQEDNGRSDYSFNYNLNLEPGSYLLLVQTGSARRTVVVIVSD
ncbi:T9SS type A sorting domain-containing protein [Neolewinella aurantiaca]|uniref:T9SS type A sorting domain-containing protein n=1 Tax=Neolewinella aurantiaca TaxID=2602767 RepID=A0A5C7FEH0_9BACT|nr:T9SS type A sorting domain-containing protein [Neolewinella aurantiaca]